MSSTSSLDSTAVFRERVVTLGLDCAWAAFSERGWTTFGAFAFASGANPNNADDDKWVREVLVPILGSPTHVLAQAVRRLYYECFVMAAADFKRRVTASSDDAPARMANAEREDRRKRLAAKLDGGLELIGETDPSNELIDLAASMAEVNTVSYIPWERCTARDQELDRPAGSAYKNLWKPGSQGYLREQKQEPELTADVSGAHMSLKLKYALTRRALAMDMVGLMNIKMGDKITAYLVRKSLAEPPAPGYASATLEQVRRADVFIWKTFARLCRDGIRRDAQDKLPLETHLNEVLKDSDLALILQPLPERKPEAKKDKERRSDGGEQPIAKTRRQNRREAFQKAKKERDEAIERANRAEAAQRRPAAIATRADDVTRGSRMPRELIGMHSRTAD